MTVILIVSNIYVRKFAVNIIDKQDVILGLMLFHDLSIFL